MGDRHSAEFGEQTVLGPLCSVAGRGGGVVSRYIIVYRNHIHHIRLRLIELKFTIPIVHVFVVRVGCRVLRHYLYIATKT